ncbi:unnamed protein product [Polarella glacialis]|uniref:Uncharacterized protein n=1 Tax=Polarella glacialis TaxID=89957 RepID=A0A813L0I0_POLGL|nr:unnamed protein product [Polarella glacialis]CAE8719226.1 unnamed protein product [Polarella glacialis]|mmetsp:Transcript_28464/g.50875  ORF Transcript_28464/g.50875 Transcript_28464/m.50875 type:complete len:384 (-) Transcript_28464:165-1316(-)
MRGRVAWLALAVLAVCSAEQGHRKGEAHDHNSHEEHAEDHAGGEHGNHADHQHSHKEHAGEEHKHDADHHQHDHGHDDHAHHQDQPIAEKRNWFWAYASALGMSAISFVGVAMLGLLSVPKLGPVVEYSCLAFAGTVLVADALVHLLPHALEGADHAAMTWVGLSATAGCLAILAIPGALEFHHHHHESEGGSNNEHHVHPYGVANLVTEMLHNFVDGITLGLAWMASTSAGISATIAVAVHELPQELGDFMVLRSAGFPVGRLLFWNFLASLTCVAGVALVHAMGETPASAAVQRYMTAFTAGSFLSLALNMIFPQVSASISKNHSGSNVGYAKLLCCALSALAIFLLVKIGELETDHHDHGSGHGHAHGHGHGGHSHGQEL